MADLPLELIFLIFSHLPTKSLLRFRATSKPLRSLIDSATFLSLQSSLSTDLLLILRHKSDLFVSNFDTLDVAVETIHPLMCYGNRLKILGSLHGLLCLSNVAEDIAIWNPCTRKYKIIALLPVEKRAESDTSLFAARVYGSGYCKVSDDYKIVRISYYIDLHTREYESRVKVYSLRRNCWRSVENLPYALICERTMGVFVGGFLHWVVTKKLEPDSPDLIVGFDLSCEEFKEVPLPELEIGNGIGIGIGSESFQIGVALLGRDLCMLVNYQNKRFEVWVMREYGRKESWCNLFSLYHSIEYGNFKFLRPLAYSRDGRKVLLEVDKKRLYWFDLRSKRTSLVTISSMPSSIEGAICVGSLVPPVLESKIDKKQLELEAKKERDAFLSEGFKLVL